MSFTEGVGEKTYILELIVSYAIEYMQWGGDIDTISPTKKKKRKACRGALDCWMDDERTQKKLLLGKNNTRKWKECDDPWMICIYCMY